MSISLIPRVLAAALIATLPTVAQAQEVPADDWDFGNDRARKATIAAVTFDTFGVAVRCLDGSLSVVMSGLPRGSGERRLAYGVAGQAMTASTWISGPDSGTAFALWPRSVARDLVTGGQLNVSVPDGQQAARRYRVEIPPSEQSIQRVFSACGETFDPVSSDQAPRSEDFAGLQWVTRPEVKFPVDARYESGIAAIRCATRPDGRLRGCKVESEFPEGSDFGRSATLAAHQTGRVGRIDSGTGTIEGRTIVYVVRYGVYDAYIQPPPSRLPDREETYNPPPSVRQ